MDTWTRIWTRSHKLCQTICDALCRCIVAHGVQIVLSKDHRGLVAGDRLDLSVGHVQDIMAVRSAEVPQIMQPVMRKSVRFQEPVKGM